MKNVQNEKILLAKIIDKINESKSKNKIANSEFLNEQQINIVNNELKTNKTLNYMFGGGFDEAQRKIAVIYPKNVSECEVKEADFLEAIKIELPSEVYGKFKHKDFLGTAMSFGLGRERFGDIIVYDDLAYIIVLNENAEYIKNSFKLERNFKKSNISIINVNEIHPKELEFENIQISINSNRLDNVISEILNTSRKIAQTLIKDEKIILNYSVEIKNTKAIKEQDILVIRGKGKYIISEFLGKNKKEKEVILIKKYK